MADTHAHTKLFMFVFEQFASMKEIFYFSAFSSIDSMQITLKGLTTVTTNDNVICIHLHLTWKHSHNCVT